jgi:hypothetical protein
MRPDFWYILIRVFSITVIVIAVARSSGIFAARPTTPENKRRGIFHGIH